MAARLPQPQRTFGGDGRVETRVSRLTARGWFPNRLSRPNGLSISSAGKIVIAGPDAWGEDTPKAFQVARLHGGACPRR